MQVSDKGGQGLVAVVGLSVGGQDPKATLQRQEACHNSCQGASSLPPTPQARNPTTGASNIWV